MDGFLVVSVEDLVAVVTLKQYLQDPLDLDLVVQLDLVGSEEVDSAVDSTEVEGEEVSVEVETSKTEVDMAEEAEVVSDTRVRDSPEEAATTPTFQRMHLLVLKVAEVVSGAVTAALPIAMVSLIAMVAQVVGIHAEEMAILVVEIVAHLMVDQDQAEATMSR